MKIRAIKGFAGDGFSFHAGETKEVSEELGKSLIKDGLAEAEAKKTTAKVQTTVVGKNLVHTAKK